MKRNLKIVLSLIILALCSSQAFSQGLNALVAVDTSNIYAFGNGGKVVASHNGGLTWSRNTGGTVNYLCASNVAGNIFVGGSDGKVYSTVSPSHNLTGVATGTTNAISGISMKGFIAGYVCADGGLVYKTTDFGVTWVLKNSGIPNVKLNAISFGDESNGVTVGNGGAIYKTTNGGNNWTAVTSGTTRNLLAVRSIMFDYFVAGEWGVFFKGTIPGNLAIEPWNLKTKSDFKAITGATGFSLHIAGTGGVIRNNLLPAVYFETFELSPLLSDISGMEMITITGKGFACSNVTDAIIKTTNSGTSWEFTAGATRSISWVSKLSASSGIGNNLCLNPNNKDEMYVAYGKTMYRSMNRAETWTNFGTIGASSGSVSAAHSFYVSPLDTNIIMCAIEGSPTDKVVRSTNYGATWTTIVERAFSNYGQPLEMDQNNPNIWYFAPDGGGFYKSTNNGANFTEISGNYPFRSPCDLIVEWGNSNNVFCADGITGSGLAEIFKSTNGGVNWTKVHTNPTASEIPSMCNTQFDAKLTYATNWSQSNRFKTTNNGANWVAIQSTSFSGWGSDMCREDPNVVLTGNYGQNSSFTTNGGANWTEYSMPSGGCGAGIIVPERGYLVAMQCSGILKMNIVYSVILNVEEQVFAGIPSKFALNQNYPNPFNPSTEIRYDLTKSGNATMKIYNQAGKEVYTLVNGYKNAGSYSVKFDASSFSSGVYYYTLEAEGNVSTKKMVLVK